MKVTRTTEQRFNTTTLTETAHPSYSFYGAGYGSEDSTPVVSLSDLYKSGPKIEVFLTREEVQRLMDMFNSKPLTA